MFKAPFDGFPMGNPPCFGIFLPSAGFQASLAWLYGKSPEGMGTLARDALLEAALIIMIMFVYN